MNSNKENLTLNAEAKNYSKVNSHWHLSFLRLKKTVMVCLDFTV